MKKKFFYVDLIKVVAISLVVFLHTAGVHLSDWNKVTFGVWMVENVYDAFTRMSVPLFVMISGAMLLQKEEPYYDFFKKRMSKILIPSIAWIGIYLWWRLVFTGEHLGIKSMIKMVITGPVYYHLWFLYMIVGLYLITPFLRKITTHSTEKELLYFSGLWIIFSSIFPTFFYFINVKYHVDLQFGITIPFLAQHIGYFILGYLLNQYRPQKNHIFLSWIGVICGWLLTTFGTLYVTSILGNFNDTFYSYFSPTVVLEAISAFILLMHYGKILEDVVSEKTKSFFSSLGTASFGVYLIHPLIRDVLLRHKLYFCVDTLEISPIISNPLAAIEVIILSYLIVFFLLKIPILNLTVGGGQAPKNQSKSSKLEIEL